MEEIVYFEINNWFSGRDYPLDETFAKWISDMQFANDDWCKENKLCVITGPIDMSSNYLVAAPKSWVIENCPKLLTDESYTYQTVTYCYDKEKNDCVNTVHDHTKKYSDFLCHPDEYGEVFGHIADDWQFPEYCEENFGVQWNDSWWGDNEDDDDEEEEEDVENNDN